MNQTVRSAKAAVATVGTVALATLTGLAPALPASAADGVPTAKNIIVLISDGAGYNHFDIANLYQTGTTMNQVRVDPASGAIEHMASIPTQVYDTYPVQVAQSHYSANGRAFYTDNDAWDSFRWVATGATDSAAAATALGAGVKTNNGTIGFNPAGDRLVTIVEHASQLGKATGLVTTVPFNHATPAGFVAHNANRNDYQGLATEMIDSDLDVIMGGGHPNFTDAHTSRVPNYTWISQADFSRLSAGQTPYRFIENRGDFEALAQGGGTVPDRVFGLAQVAETLQYNRPGLTNNTVLPGTDPYNDVPDLQTMTNGALNVLSKQDNGFFLMVEGGAVDWAGHANQTTRVIEEQIDFNQAVEAIDTWVNANSSWEETLVIITADHETGYLGGPGAEPTWTPMLGSPGTLPQVSWKSGDHTNSLVPLFAKGAGSELLAARATSWDKVRGAYLDNTDIGESLFDLFGFGYSGNEGAVPLEAAIGLDTQPGALSLAVASLTTPVAFTDAQGTMTASLPRVTVRDTRSGAQSQGGGWALSGRANNFTAGNRVIGAENLTWTPAVVSSNSGAAAGPSGNNLAQPATLAAADENTRAGQTVLSAALALGIPNGTDPGLYGSEITLTLFATD